MIKVMSLNATDFYFVDSYLKIAGYSDTMLYMSKVPLSKGCTGNMLYMSKVTLLKKKNI